MQHYQEIGCRKMAFGDAGYTTAAVIAILFAFNFNHVAGIPLSRGVLDARNSTAQESFCIVYYPNITTLPSNKTDPKFAPLVDLSMWDGCGEDTVNRTVLQNLIPGKMVVTANGNCSLNAKARIVESYNGRGLLIVMSHVIHVENNTVPSKIPIAFILDESKDILVNMGDKVEVFVYSPTHTSRMDYSLLVIWTIAVVTVGIGAYWSGLVRFELQQKQQHMLMGDGSTGSEQQRSKAQQQEEVSLSVTPVLVAVFVVCMCGMLLLLYFFFSYLVYVIIGLFTIASTTAVYQCLEPLVRKLPIGAWKLPRCSFYVVKFHPEVRQLLLAAGAVSLSVCWLVYRKKGFAWILQDILGFAFSVNMLRLIRLPSLKICTLLLVLLFFYDIFFVFITPLFTKNGQSVMVEVATGGGSGVGGGFGGGDEPEQLPMVVKVPLLEWEPLDVCGKPYSLLGYGDILVPGMLVAFCHGFDLATHNRKKMYFIVTLLAYGLGLIATFIGLFMMAVAQPALLYLVPFTLIPVMLLGAARNELKQLWNGDGQTVETQRLNDNGRLEGSLAAGHKDPQAAGSPADSDGPSDTFARSLI